MSVSKTSPSSKHSDCANSPVYDIDLLASTSCLSSESSNHLPLHAENSEKTRENSLCFICLGPAILTLCQYPNCHNFFHLSCISLYFPELESKKTCPAHSFKNLDIYKKRLNLALNSNSSTYLQSLVKDQKSSQNHSDLTGKLFWYCINQQYFPYFTGKKPEFGQKPKKKLKSNSPSWINMKIQNLQNELQDTANKTASLLDFDKVFQNFSINSFKNSENFFKTGVLQLSLQDSLQKTSEALADHQKNVLPKDYYSHQNETDIICAICDDGDSTLDNLIVICSKCNIAVHSWCYNIEQIPENDWLCDPCSESLSPNCVLCPVKGGSLKKAKEKWVHVTCAKYLLCTEGFNWNLKDINKDKFRVTCFACGSKTGACVQCSFGKCITSFHVECRKDLIEVEDSSVCWLCPVHKKGKLSRLVKAEQESGFQFIDQIAEEFWKESFKETEKKKRIIMKVFSDCVRMKVCVGNKVVKEQFFVEEEKVKRKGVIRAVDSSKGELWVKLIVPRDVYESCSKRLKV